MHHQALVTDDAIEGEEQLQQQLLEQPELAAEWKLITDDAIKLRGMLDLPLKW